MSFLDLGNYDQPKEAYIEETSCHSCKQNKICLCADSAPMEYGPVNLCFDCIQELFKNYFDEDETPTIKEPGHD